MSGSLFSKIITHFEIDSPKSQEFVCGFFKQYIKLIRAIQECTEMLVSESLEALAAEYVNAFMFY